MDEPPIDRPQGVADAEASTPAPPPVPGAVPRQMFDKPNLQLRDPDPYAFANRIRKLVLLASVLLCVVAAPFLAKIVAYHVRRGQMEAEVEVASKALGDLAPRLAGFEQASRMVVKKVGPAVVSIQVLQGSGRMSGEGQGSGFVVDRDGYVLTNFHLIENAQRVWVQFTSGEMSDASVVAADPPLDLALLKVDGGNLPVVEWGDSDGLQPGDFVWAVGTPFGLESTVTFGIVSAKARRSASGLTDNLYQEFLQSDAAVNPGNSGGPLVNLAGQVVGVNTAIIGRSYRGVSFAIPANLAREKYEQLRTKGYVERGFLGIRPVAPSDVVRSRMGLTTGKGVLVAEVTKKTPAEIAGLRPGDVILRWNDHEAADPTLLSREIASTEIGSTASVLIRRDENGKPVDKTLAVRVGRNGLAGAQ
ncbi:MAG: S1C family serine protease [Lacipirellulaceae bacterium]